jgi:hypothetical protein
MQISVFAKKMSRKPEAASLKDERENASLPP